MFLPSNPSSLLFLSSLLSAPPVAVQITHFPDPTPPGQLAPTAVVQKAIKIKHSSAMNHKPEQISEVIWSIPLPHGRLSYPHVISCRHLCHLLLKTSVIKITQAPQAIYPSVSPPLQGTSIFPHSSHFLSLRSFFSLSLQVLPDLFYFPHTTPIKAVRFINYF